jgi:anti-sigma factor (TIGR02949 family)
MDSEKAKKVEITQVFSQEEVSFDYYSCEEAINRLNDYLDHELNAQERQDVVKHLQICKPCLERFHFEEKLIVAIRTRVAGIAAPAALKDRLRSIFQPKDCGKD